MDDDDLDDYFSWVPRTESELGEDRVHDQQDHDEYSEFGVWEGK